MDRRTPLAFSDSREGEAGSNQDHPESPTGREQGPRSWFRRTLRGVAWLSAAPADWMGLKTISSAATLLGRLYRRTRGPARRDSRFKTNQGRVFDVAGTAFAYGISEQEVERRLSARRRQTATLAYLMFGLACFFVLAWVHLALRTASDGVRAALLLQFLPFCALFYLMSFYQALINFQIRSGRTVGWHEYLATEEGFLPRW